MSRRRKFKVRSFTSVAVAALACFAAPFFESSPMPGPHAACARSRPPALAPDTVNLIYQLSAQPELMNLSYLRYVVGSPENERSQLAGKAKNYYWYQEPKRSLRYQLHQDGPQPGTVTRSIFTVALPDSQLTTKEMERLFGQNHRRVFDYQSYPTDVYQFHPNTYVAFTQPHDTFRVSKIQIGYEGPPLAQPPQEAVLTAYNTGKNRAVEMAMKKGHWQEAIGWLRRDAAMRPQDPYVHIQLGTAYRAGLMINEAITEYGTAARLGAGDPEVEKICRAAFVDMKILPPQHHQAPQQRRGYLAGNSPVSAAAGL